MVDMASITLTLIPYERGKTPRWLGRATHSWFLDTLAQIHPSFSQTLHDRNSIKPFTISNLIGARVRHDRLWFKDDDILRLRITTLHPHLTLIILNQAVPWWCQQNITLHGQTFAVQDAQTERGWSGCTTFESLLKGVDEDARDIHMTFVSPTTFKRTGDYFDAMPYPTLVFGSLLDRWNAFAPVLLPLDVNDAIDKIAIQHHVLNSETISLGGGRLNRDLPAFTGRVHFRLAEGDRTLRRYLHVLAAFAKYSGIGYKTTMGFGQARVR